MMLAKSSIFRDWKVLSVLTIIVMMFVSTVGLYALYSLFPGAYPIELESYWSRYYFTVPTDDPDVYYVSSGAFSGTDGMHSLSFPISNVKSHGEYSALIDWSPFYYTSYCDVELGNNKRYKLTVTHGDAELITPDTWIWDYEKDYITDNPQTINITYTVDHGEDGKEHTIVTYRVYRFWSTITMKISGERLDVYYEGTVNAELMKGSLANALDQINKYSHAHEARIVPHLSVSPMAITANTDWFGFLGCWVAGISPDKSGTIGGSNAEINYQNPHSVIGMYRDYSSEPFTVGTPAYKIFTDYHELGDYTLEQLQNIPKETLSNHVYIPIDILDFGVTYSAQEGDTADYQSFVSYGGTPSLTLRYVYDILTTQEVTWWEEYRPPPPPPYAEAGHLNGMVFSADSGLPLSGVQVEFVEISGYSATSAPDGYYEILNIPEGEYVVKANKIGYEEARASVVITIGATTQKNLTLTPIPGPWWMGLLTWTLISFGLIGGGWFAYTYVTGKQRKDVSIVPLILMLAIVGAIIVIVAIAMLWGMIQPWWWG